MLKYFFAFFSLTIFSVSLNQLSAQTKSQKEIEVFARQIEQSLINQNPSYFNSLFDSKELIDNILIKNRDHKILTYNLGFQKGFYQSFDMGSTFIEQIQNNGTFEYLHSYIKGDIPVLLFRSFSGQGLNYYELYVDTKDAKLVISDIFEYMSGELISESIERDYQTSLTNYLPKLANLHITPERQQMLKNIEKSQALLFKEKYKKAFKTWSAGYEFFADNRSFLLQGIKIAAIYKTAIYTELVATYNNLFPGDPGYYLSSLNALYGKDAYLLSLDCLDSLDVIVGNDPILDYLRAQIYSNMGNQNKTITAYERLINSMPLFEPGYLQLFDLYISKEDFQEALGVLDKMTVELDYYKEDFNEFLKNYPSLLSTEMYTQWMGN